MQITDLVLLVGTNPLPNYVVADYLLQQQTALKTIWLIHSPATHTYAQNIQALIQSKNHSLDNIKLVQLSDVSRNEQIQNDTENHLISKLNLPVTHLHLNYTGGTKAMVTHIYQTLKKNQEKMDSCTFSYLDANSFKLIYDDEVDLDSGDLRQDINLSLPELLQLHGYEKQSGEEPPQVTSKAAIQLFKDAIIENRLSQYFDDKTGFQRMMFIKKGKSDLAVRPSEIESENFNGFQPNDLFHQITHEMPVKIFDKDKNFNIIRVEQAYLEADSKKTVTNKTFEKSIDFLAGTWLEEYVYDCLVTGLSQSFPEIKNIWLGWHIKKERPNYQFELDLVFLRGYQLFVVSCTTSDEKPLCKSKGFEVLLRSRQIGGDEARSIVVCRASQSNVEKLTQELQSDLGRKANICILGADDLHPKDLVHKIKDFIGE